LSYSGRLAGRGLVIWWEKGYIEFMSIAVIVSIIGAALSLIAAVAPVTVIITTTRKDTEQNRKSIDSLAGRIDKLDGKLNGRIDKLDGRIDSLRQEMNERFDKLDSRLRVVEVEVGEMRGSMFSGSEYFERYENSKKRTKSLIAADNEAEYKTD
jgi:hypothetical protein